MPSFRATCNYRSSLGSFNEGDVVELEAELAEHIGRDCPGCLVPNKPVASTDGQQERSEDGPPVDRSISRPKVKRGR